LVSACKLISFVEEMGITLELRGGLFASTKKGEPPAFIESLLLYNYYKKNNRFPMLNNSF